VRTASAVLSGPIFHHVTKLDRLVELRRGMRKYEGEIVELV
jgi:hypothetical protein